MEALAQALEAAAAAHPSKVIRGVLRDLAERLPETRGEAYEYALVAGYMAAKSGNTKAAELCDAAADLLETV